MDFKNYLKENAQKVNETLEIVLLDFLSETRKTNPKLLPFAKELVKSCKGGKRIRGVLVNLGYQIALPKFHSNDIFKVGAAFDTYDSERDKREINKRVTAVLNLSVEGWSSLGWPKDKIKRPKGGFKYLVSTPINIPKNIECFSGAELLDFYIARRCAVKLSSSRSFNPEEDRYIRIILMQDEAKVLEAFSRLRASGIYYDMDFSNGIIDEYTNFLSQNVRGDF